MKLEEKALLKIISRALFGVDVNIPQAINYELFYKAAMEQAVPILVFDALSKAEKAEMPEPLYAVWQKQTMQLVMRNEQLLTEQKNVLERLKISGIPCVILKGSSTAINYPNPSLRIMGDIDILTTPELQKTAVSVLQAIGFGQPLDSNHHCHLSIQKGNFFVEMHNEPNGLHLVYDENIKAQFRSFFATAIKFSHFENDIPILAVEHQAVVLLLHKLEHFLNGELGLRQLCDWACFVEKHFTPSRFDALRDKLSQLGILEFCGVITRVCCDYLGLPTVKAPWCMQYDTELSREVIENILSGGSFGRKDSMYGQRYFVDAQSKNRISSLFKMVKLACYHHWPICKKYKVLLIIAPIVIFTKYLKLRLKGERATINPIALYKRAGPRLKLYKSLKPFKGE